MNLRLGRDRRRAVSGIIVAVIIFAMLFTAGTGYLFFQAKNDLSSYQANVQALQRRAQISQEQLSFQVSNRTNGLLVTVTDDGAYPISVVGTFVNGSSGRIVNPPGVMTLGTPVNLNVGEKGNFTISDTAYVYISGIVHVSLITSRGNVFTRQYPLNNTVIVSTITSETTVSLTGPNAGGAGGNSLVAVMSATPVQVFSGPCPGIECITDNVTLFNYSRNNMTGAGLHPTTPWFNVTGTAELTSSSCTGPYTPPGAGNNHSIPDPSGTIPGYNGSGVAPHIYFLCTYAPQTGAVGGLASFSGWAFATQNKTVIDSAGAVSNLVQIGGLTNALAQGVFSTNFFFFKYSSCTKAPESSVGSFQYSATDKCTPNTAMPPSSPDKLPEGAVISGGSNFYVAFYIQITNNYNTTVPLLQYTFMQVDPSDGGETDWWLVGTNTTMSNGVYYPDYDPGTGSQLPTLTAYPNDCNVVNPINGRPIDPNCIYVDPGQTVTITLAACGFSSSNWDWGGDRYGMSWDNGNATVGCTPGGATPAIDMYYAGDATAATTVISFQYRGQIMTEDIAFNGIAFIS